MEAGLLCGGHGTCETGAGCACSQSAVDGWWASKTEGRCDICSPSGYGDGCLCADALCSSHGLCTSSGCSCFSSDSTGYWQQADNTCNICADDWYGPGCKCHTADCNGHGECRETGCACHRPLSYEEGPGIGTLGAGYFTGDGSACAACGGMWSVYPHCLCETSDCNGHGACTPDGCSCQEADLGEARGAFVSSDQAMPRNCAACAAGYSGELCLCSAENCFTAVTAGDALRSEVLSFHRYVVGNQSYGSTVRLAAPAGALVARGGPTELTVEVMRVEEAAKVHPRRTGPLGGIFMENTFSFTYRTRTLAGTPDTPGDDDSTANSTNHGDWALLEVDEQERAALEEDAEDAERIANTRAAKAQSTTTPSVVFREYIVFETTFVWTPEKPSADASTAYLAVLDDAGWSRAGDSCPGNLQYETVNEDLGMLSTRVCSLPKDALLAVFASPASESDFPWSILIACLGVLGAVLISLQVLHRMRKKVEKARKEKEMKDTLIQFMHHRDPGGPSLRERLGLRPGEEFTAEKAAAKLVRRLEKNRETFGLLMQRSEFQQVQLLLKAITGEQLSGSSVQNLAAMDALTAGEKSIRKIWEFTDDELHLLEACRLMRGLIWGAQQKAGPVDNMDPANALALDPALLPVMHRELLEAKTENVKLRRIVLALKESEALRAPPASSPSPPCVIPGGQPGGYNGHRATPPNPLPPQVPRAHLQQNLQQANPAPAGAPPSKVAVLAHPALLGSDPSRGPQLPPLPPPPAGLGRRVEAGPPAPT
ncbi:Teneurin-m [Diplonema papillatum]|nr:Teneurin-m [Diplonema papillatum]